jgi:uncharacterized protein YbjT (DUF2867 family)
MASLHREAFTGAMNENMQPKEFTLVTGGTGKTGRRVAERLAAQGVAVRVGSRSGEPPFDWQDQATWPPALRDVDQVYLSYYPDLAFPGAAEAIRSLAGLADASGVRRLVLLSGRGESEAQRCERIVQGYQTEWTIVRASVFAQNFSEYDLQEPVRSGVVAFPAGDTAEPFIDVDDIADVAVAALTGSGHAGQIYEVTGPRLLTFTEAVAEIAAAAGREVRYQPVSPDEYAAALVAQGVPAEFASQLRNLFGTIFDGRNAYLADGVQRALGRPPRDFADYVRAAAATGVWNAE